MRYGAIDLHKKESQVQLITDAGEIVDRRIPTQRDAFTQLFAASPPMRILLEASTESEWVATHLETLGHEVIVADPNYAPMYGRRSRRIKTDRRDVSALLEANRGGIFRGVHRRSLRSRALQRELRVRTHLIRTRTRAIALARALTRSEGCRIASGARNTFPQRLGVVSMPPVLRDTLQPLSQQIAACTETVDALDARLAVQAARDPVLRRLMTVPGIGAVTATAFVAALDDVTRFRRADQVTSYLGLTPREYSSGERQQRGHVLRSAHPDVQALLVQAAWCVWRSRRGHTAELRSWAEGIARRRGRMIAAVALARRLARLLFAIWRDGTVYRPLRAQVRATTAVGDGATVEV
jgi:transposase